MYPDKIAAYCFERYQVPVTETLDRLHLIAREAEQDWKKAGTPIYDDLSGTTIGREPVTGPWSYLAGKPLAGAHIIIDEVHNFCGSIGTPRQVSNQWQKWLGELGHNQAVFRCLTQAPEKVHNCIKQEAQAHITIRNTGIERDPYFGIQVLDWLELWCGLTGSELKVYVFEQETQKIEGKAVKGQRNLHRMGPPYFDFYDSFNAPIEHEQAEDVKPFEHEYQKHLAQGPIKGRLSLVRWFLAKNLAAVGSRLLVGIILLCVITGLMSGQLTRVLTKQVMNVTGGATIGGKDKPVKKTASAKPLPAKDPNSMSAPEMQKLLARIQTEKQQLELQKSQMSALTLITPNSITLTGGYTFDVNETIDIGAYAGQRLKAINWDRRCAILDSNTVLYLGGAAE